MTGTKNKKEIFKCNVCGNIVEVLHVGGAELMCCGQPMELRIERTQDEGSSDVKAMEDKSEKHVPIIEKTDNGYKVKVGSVAHPMEDEHYIEWIELIVEGDLYARKFLTPGQIPEVEFAFTGEAVLIGAREFCTLHSLWKSKN